MQLLQHVGGVSRNLLTMSCRSPPASSPGTNYDLDDDRLAAIILLVDRGSLAMQLSGHANERMIRLTINK